MSRPSGKKPFLIPFEEIGNSETGFITTTQKGINLPFIVQRVFWIYETPPSIVRGNHANKMTEEVMVAIKGKALVETETLSGEKQVFELSNPVLGLYIPAFCWITIKIEQGTILLCLASTDFAEEDYINDLNEFRKLKE